MSNDANARALVVIPARGGSKGIPRKNLRPLAGQPLIAHSIRAALASSLVDRVVVSTDDQEIALIARRFGADVIMRPSELAGDDVTLDPVVEHLIAVVENEEGRKRRIVVTVQPTSPLVKHEDIDEAVRLLADSAADTVMSVVDDRHLQWAIKGGVAEPLYAARVNRQQLPATYRETGAVIACTREQLSRGSRIGLKVALMEMPHERAIDIDSYSDWYLCEALMNRKRIAFIVIGYPEVGYGHVYRALLIANEFIDHEIRFFCSSDSSEAAVLIKSMNYPVTSVEPNRLQDAVLDFRPNVIVNDILDTEANYVKRFRDHGIKIVNFEDLGTGAAYCDLVFNALYSDSQSTANALSGFKYFCLRDEFIYCPSRKQNAFVKKLLITFGGVDEGNLTRRVVKLIANECRSRGITIDIVTGPGYRHIETLEDVIVDGWVNLHHATREISTFMLSADLAITSGGRTVLELAAIGTPTIVICQNKRETTHTFASAENGVVNLGLRTELSDEQIVEEVLRVVDSPELLNDMHQRAGALNLKEGKRRVVNLIREVMANHVG